MSEKINNPVQKGIEKVVIKCTLDLINGTNKVLQERLGHGPDKDDIRHLLWMMGKILDKEIRCSECKKVIEWEETDHHWETCEKFRESGLPPKVIKVMKEMLRKAQEENILESYGFAKENLVEFQEYFGGEITEVKMEKFYLLASKSRHFS